MGDRVGTGTSYPEKGIWGGLSFWRCGFLWVVTVLLNKEGLIAHWRRGVLIFLF